MAAIITCYVKPESETITADEKRRPELCTPELLLLFFQQQ
jgi:hypothetical protein